MTLPLSSSQIFGVSRSCSAVQCGAVRCGGWVGVGGGSVGLSPRQGRPQRATRLSRLIDRVNSVSFSVHVVRIRARGHRRADVAANLSTVRIVVFLIDQKTGELPPTSLDIDIPPPVGVNLLSASPSDHPRTKMSQALSRIVLWHFLTADTIPHRAMSGSDACLCACLDFT